MERGGNRAGNSKWFVIVAVVCEQRAVDFAGGEHASSAAIGQTGREQQHRSVEWRLAGVRVQRWVRGVLGDSAQAGRQSVDSALCPKRIRYAQPADGGISGRV